jgi:hypothetical protein
MDWLAAHAFAICVWALIYWGSIKALDRDNPKNTFGLALWLGGLFTLSFMFPLPGIVMVVAWLVLLIRVSMWQYDLGLVPAAIASAATVFVPYFGARYLFKFVGDSDVRAYVLVYGVPAVTLAVYLASRIKGRNAEPKMRWAGPPTTPELPEARVAAIGKPVAAPIVAPLKYDPGAHLGDKPTLLT